jgi:hypothetical protein
MKDLIINKPENPLDHLINKLDEPDCKLIKIKKKKINFIYIKLNKKIILKNKSRIQR